MDKAAWQVTVTGVTKEVDNILFFLKILQFVSYLTFPRKVKFFSRYKTGQNLNFFGG